MSCKSIYNAGLIKWWKKVRSNVCRPIKQCQCNSRLRRTNGLTDVKLIAKTRVKTTAMYEAASQTDIHDWTKPVCSRHWVQTWCWETAKSRYSRLRPWRSTHQHKIINNSFTNKSLHPSCLCSSSYNANANLQYSLLSVPVYDSRPTVAYIADT